MTKCTLLLLFVLIFKVSSDKSDFLRIKESLLRTIKFTQTYYYDINVDGLLGISFAYSTLMTPVREEFKEDVEEIQEELKKTYFKVYPVIETYNEATDMLLKHMAVLDIWTRPPTYGKLHLDPNPKVPLGHHDVTTFDGFYKYLDEYRFYSSSSDVCFLEVLNATSGRKAEDGCLASDECREYGHHYPEEFEGSWPAYGVTHRLIYLQLARARGCSLPDYSLEYVKKYCSYIYWELKTDENFGFIKQMDDLVLEQITICGLEGFQEFFDRKYLEHILDIQHDSGCFGTGIVTGRERVRFRKLGKSRRKRESYSTVYGCNSHTTGLAISSLALYLIREIE